MRRFMIAANTQELTTGFVLQQQETRYLGGKEVRLIKVPANRLGHTRILPLKGKNQWSDGSAASPG